MRFYAAFKGVDIDKEDKEKTQERFDAIKKRAEAKAAGLTDEQIEKNEALDFSDFGFEVEVM